jgi:hypothetical protein
MKKIFDVFKVSPVIYNYKINNGKMSVHDRIFSRLMFCFGAVPGNKTNTIIKIPQWILFSKNSKIKIKFLQGLFDSELSTISIIKDKKNSYQSLNFYNCKTIRHVDNGISYLNQIKSILKEFNITTTPVKLGKKYITKRDGYHMQQLFFIIQSNSINLYNFITKVGFLYNSKRKESAAKALIYVKKQQIIEKEKIRKYYLAMELRKEGLSAYKISNELKIDIWLIKSWLYKNRKPRLLNSVINNS